MRDESVKAYLTALDELNVIMLESYYSAERKDRVKKVQNDLYQELVEAYIMGVNHASEMMGTLIVVRIEKMEESIYREIEGEDFQDRVREHVEQEDTNALRILAETEYHRIYNEGVANAIEDYVRETGRDVLKSWQTMRDDRVRDTHFDLQGQTIPVNEYFYANDGDRALFPGGFGNAQNNINCRCWLEYR